MRRPYVRLAVFAIAVLVLAGCGSSSSSSTSTTGAAGVTVTSPAVAVDPTIASQVPAATKSKGLLDVGTEAQYAPNEFVAPDGHTIIGMDVDMVTSLASVMGLKASFHNATFESIIPGIQAGRYDVGASSFTDTKEREKSVDFVTYYKAGISFYAKSSSNPGVTTIADLCGKTVAVEKGTVEQEGAEEQNKKCAKEGKKSVTILSFPGQNPVNLAVASGRAELAMADSPVVDYQIKLSNGAFKLIGQSYNFAPYGFAMKKNGGLAQPMLAALKKLMADGTYTRILTKWGIQDGAITESEAKINGATS
jgi:polar amino acid transport system substrate-binding protein